LFDPTEFDISYIEEEISKLHRNEGFFENLKLYPWIKELLEELRSKHHILFCTKPSRNDLAKSESAKRTSIIRELWPTRSTSIITTHDKTTARGRLLFDDDPPNEWIFIPERQPIIVDQPHNQWVPGTRVYHSNLEEWKLVIIQKLLWL
jgi:5'(3')-deoxyribonucleotidase